MSAHQWAKRTGAVVGVAALLSTSLSIAAMAATDRIAGANRYGTSAEIAMEFPTAETVFLASGVNFPDALAGGAAGAFLKAPVLLTRPDGLPEPIKGELKRLKPKKIMVLGGAAAVGPGVTNTLSDYGSATTIVGADRYETAAKLSAEVFEKGADVVYVASGQNFPDALAGGPAAGMDKGPILLTRPNALPEATKAELQRLKPKTIIVLGGESAVSGAVVGALSEAAPTVTRVAGKDRYDTAIATSRHAFQQAGKVYLASGADYPDALSGGPLATAAKAPILLAAKSDATNQALCDEIFRLGAKDLVVLGGDLAVPPATVSFVERGCVPEGQLLVRGSGEQTIALPKGLTQSIVTLTYSGDKPFLAYAKQADGTTADLVQNWVKGPKTGTFLVGLGSEATALVIETTGGPWTASIQPIENAPVWNLADPLSGTASAVHRMAPAAAGAKVQLTHEGDDADRIVVRTYTKDGTSVRLVDKLGKFTEELTIPKDAVLVTVTTEGSWTLKKA